MAKYKLTAAEQAEQSALAARILYGVKQAYDTGKLEDRLPNGSFDVLKSHTDKVVAAYNAAYLAWKQMPGVIRKETRYVIDSLEYTLANRVSHEISQGIRMLNGHAPDCENPIEQISETFKGSFRNHKYARGEDPSFYVHKLIARKLLAEPARVVVERKDDGNYEDLGLSLDDLDVPRRISVVEEKRRYDDLDRLHFDNDYFQQEIGAVEQKVENDIAVIAKELGKEPEEDLDRIAASE
ncbi:MAG: hypothetical protein V1729_00395 [Candidatus Woesearchaeota archaeon]